MLAGREPERHRSVLVAPWVNGSVPTNGQTGAMARWSWRSAAVSRRPLGSGAGDADGVGARGPYWRGALRCGKRSPLAGRPVATLPRRRPRTVRSTHGTRVPRHVWRARAPRRDVPTPVSPAINITTEPASAATSQLPVGEPSRARAQTNLRPVARAPRRNTRAPDPVAATGRLSGARSARVWPSGEDEPLDWSCRAQARSWLNSAGQKEPLTGDAVSCSARLDCHFAARLSVMSTA